MVKHRARLNAHAAVLLAIPAAFVGVFFVWPLAAITRRSVHGESSLTALDVFDATVTTLQLAVWGTLGSIVLGVPAAWALYRVTWRGRALVRALVTVPFVLPTIVVAAAFSALVGRGGPLGHLGLDQSGAAIVLALIFYNVAVIVRIVGAAWEALDPRMESAARTLGASPWKAWLTVTIPSLRGPLMAAMSLVFLFCATSFAVVLVLGGTRVVTLETEIYLRVSQMLDLRAAAVLSLVQLVIAAVVIVATARTRKASSPSLATIHSTGSRAATRKDVRWIMLALLPVAMLQVPPMVALMERALRIPQGYGIDHFLALFAPPTGTALSVPVWRAAITSLMYATAAMTTAVALAVLIAAAVSIHRKRGWYDGIFVATLGVSAVTLGLGLLVGVRPVWGTSPWLIVGAQALIALPLAVRALAPAVRAVDPRMPAAAATLGASKLRVLVTIWWPQVRGAITVAAALAFAVALGEFGAATFLSRPDNPTLPTAIARLLSRPGAENVGMGFAAACLLGAVTAGVSLATERARSRTRVVGL